VIGVVECGHRISHGDDRGSNGKSPLCNQLEEALEGWELKLGREDGWVWKKMLPRPSLLKWFMHLTLQQKHKKNKSREKKEINLPKRDFKP